MRTFSFHGLLSQGLCLGLTLSCLLTTACDNDDQDFCLDGKYRREMVQKLEGFGEEKASLLNFCNMENSTFITLSTAAAWNLNSDQRQQLKQVRDGVSKPDSKTLLQKVISLEDIPTYMNNKYGGTIGGYVCEAADVKQLATMHDVYWGMRLDYEGSAFKEDGAGYGVIRFCSEQVFFLNIPYVEEMGGTQPHAWPNGGGGFTTSTLGEGGYPEWRFEGYYAPVEGAELYEVTPQGRELLRSVYTGGKWQTFESPYYPAAPTTKAEGTAPLEGKFAQYAGHRFMVRGEEPDRYLLATYEAPNLPGLFVLEKGVSGLWVSKSEARLDPQ